MVSDKSPAHSSARIVPRHPPSGPPALNSDVRGTSLMMSPTRPSIEAWHLPSSSDIRFALNLAHASTVHAQFRHDDSPLDPTRPISAA